MINPSYIIRCTCLLYISLYPIYAQRNYIDDAFEINQWLIDVRRELHKIPELLYDLPRTKSAIKTHLNNLGISYMFNHNINFKSFKI